jgi:hypothetical protein
MASAEEPCLFEVKFADQNESNPVPVYANHTNVISGGAKAAPTGETMIGIPKAFEGLVQPNAVTGGRILVYLTSDATDIAESEESQWEIPVFVYNSQGGVISRKVLTQENMTGFTQAGTVDTTLTAGVPTRIAYYDVPRGLTMGIDPNGKVRAYVGDDTA